MRADAVDAAAVEDDDAVGFLNGGDTLRDDDLGRAGNLFVERAADHRVGLGIDSGGGVVENEDLGLFEKRSGDTESLLLTAGYVCAAAFDICIVAVGELRNEFIGASELTYADELFVGCVRIAPTEIFLDRAGEEDVFLQNDGNLVAERFDIVVTNVNAADLDRTLRCVVKAGDHLHERAL